jgi:hypothetical protein
MPRATQSTRDILSETFESGRRVLVPQLATLMRRDKITEVEAAEERRRFWQRAITEQEEASLWQQGMTPYEISKQVYPDRWDMAGAEGRVHESEIAAWSHKHAQKGTPQPSAPPMTPQAPASPQPEPMVEGY